MKITSCNMHGEGHYNYVISELCGKLAIHKSMNSDPLGGNEFCFVINGGICIQVYKKFIDNVSIKK